MKERWMKRVSALVLVLSLVVSLAPSAFAWNDTDKTYTVAPGGEVTIEESFFKDLYGGGFNYLTFSDIRGLDDAGWLYVYDSAENNNDKVRIRESIAESSAFYLNFSDVGRNDYLLRGMTFAADRSAAGKTVTMDYTLYGDKGYTNRVDGTIRIEIDRSSSSSSSRADLTVRVDAGREVSLGYRDFERMFRDDRYTRSALEYVKFTGYRGLDRVGHLEAVSEKNTRKDQLAERDLNNTWFYDDARDIPRGSGDYDLTTLSFVADRNVDDTLYLDFQMVGENSSDKVDGTLEIIIGRGSGSSSSGGSSSQGRGDVNYKVKSNDSVNLNARDFDDSFVDARGTTGHLNYLVFTNYSDLDDYGYFTVKNRAGQTVELSEKDLKNRWFYDTRYAAIPASQADDCDLDTLVFNAYRSARGTLRMDYKLVGDSSSNSTNGVLEIQVGDEEAKRPAGAQDIQWTMNLGNELTFSTRDFEDYYQRYCRGELRYVRFLNAADLFRAKGNLYLNYGYRTQKLFNGSNLLDYQFYLKDNRDGDYDFSELSFVADAGFTGPLSLDFRAYGSTDYVDGRLTINGTGSGPVTPGGTVGMAADIRYTGTSAAPIQINPNDIARLYQKRMSGGVLQSIQLNGVPMTGTVYYNYYGVSPYGNVRQEAITLANCTMYQYKYSPSSTAERSMSELTYVPYGVNYCTSIPFTAYGNMGAMSGNIHISSTLKKIPEVYGVTSKDQGVSYPAGPVSSAVSNATGTTPYGIRLLSLPKPTEGKLEYNSGYATPADLNTVYSFSNGGYGTLPASGLRFTPAYGFTGNVELPYEAVDAQGKSIGSGQVSLGVVSTVKTFKDVNKNSTWCYKYVTELSSAGVIDGYSDRTFREKNSLTYGAALKLIMLGAGYPEQKPTVKNSPFSGYLAKAKADGLVDAKAKINLGKSITRLQVSQIAAKAMKLDVKNLSAQRPFTDTQDVYVQALNAAGIVEGYFSNGKSTFKPNDTLTRGHISAIVWRMQQYRK